MATRRQIIAAAFVAPTIALPSAVSAAIVAPTGPSARWYAALARMREASDKVSAFYKSVYTPHHEDLQRRIGEAEADLERRVAAIPHYETRQQIMLPSGERRSLSTAIQIDVLVAADFDRRRHDLSGEDPEYAACCMELHPQAVRRANAEKALRENFAAPEIDPQIWAECERLEAASLAAWNSVVCFEAENLSNLIAKIEYLRSEDCEVDHAELLADLARIYGSAQA